MSSVFRNFLKNFFLNPQLILNAERVARARSANKKRAVRLCINRVRGILVSRV